MPSVLGFCAGDVASAARRPGLSKPQVNTIIAKVMPRDNVGSFGGFAVGRAFMVL